MARPVISYDKDLPEIPDQVSHLAPESYLRKKKGTENDYEIVDGRRPSKLLLVSKLRDEVKQWREGGYPGCSPVIERLFTFWFEEDHLTRDGAVFRYYFAQREAVETLVYLVEIKKVFDTKELIDHFAEVFYPEGSQQRLESDIKHQTGMDGKRQILRYIPEVESETVQDLPPKDLPRYAIKMATGSGKTVVMAMLMVWSYYHKKKVTGSSLSDNFLIIAPNVIVYQRLEKDFRDNYIFRELPLIPGEWIDQWCPKLILRGDSSEPDPAGNLFLTNIQQIYESRDKEWEPGNAVQSLLGPKPVKDLGAHGRSMLERIKSLSNVMVINDEAHHVHDDENLEWNKTLLHIHENIPEGLTMWLDFSATPKDLNGTYFPWIICDYPLAQAVENRIVKVPLIVHKVSRGDPDTITKENVIECYGEWLVAAMERWQEHYKTFKAYKQKPVLFVMVESNAFADIIGEWIAETYKLKIKKEVLVIHTDREGEITKKDLEVARAAARDIDSPKSKIKVIVSVLMLREGWDVRNVTVVLGLRPFTSKAKILPEQAVGRGLRLMNGIGPDRTQTLEVMGTRAFEDFVRRLEIEGVGIKTVTEPPKPPVQIRPVQEKSEFDISIPRLHYPYIRNYLLLDELDYKGLAPIYDQEELEEPFRIQLRMEYAETETTVSQVDIDPGHLLAQDIVSSITNRVIKLAGLTGAFARLCPIVRGYITHRCFGQTVDLENTDIRNRLANAMIQQGIAGYLARVIGNLTAVKQTVELKQKNFILSEVAPFTWRRNLPPLECSKTIFNYVATYNNYEKNFARFLEKCDDIIRFASLGATEQESGTCFRVDYIKPSGAIGFYHPDFVAVQKTKDGEASWIIETKGRIWEDTLIKDGAITEWCRKVSEQTGALWQYIRVNQTEFERGGFAFFKDVVAHLKKAKWM